MIGSGFLDFGYPILEIATESRNGSTQELVKDGIVEIDGYWRVIITPTANNSNSGLSRMPKNCDNSTQIYLSDYQECQTCDDFFYPKEDNLECIQDRCAKFLDIQLLDGRCKRCPEFTHPDALNRECVSDPCASNTEILLENGQCEFCPDYTHPDNTKDFKECTSEECSPR